MTRSRDKVQKDEPEAILALNERELTLLSDIARRLDCARNPAVRTVNLAAIFDLFLPKRGWPVVLQKIEEAQLKLIREARRSEGRPSLHGDSSPGKSVRG
jgi:hypothetical protein